MECLGHQLHEVDIKRGLRELDAGFNFDMGANLNIVHPMMNVRQGVFYNGRHIAPMDRGMVPEHNITVRDNSRPSNRNDIVWRVGWRNLFERTIGRGILTRQQISGKFSLPVTFFTDRKRFFHISNSGKVLSWQ